MNSVISFSILDVKKQVSDNISDNNISSNNANELIDCANNQPLVTLKDISIIQCFWGNDIARIKSTVHAISMMLNSNPKPNNWIFVEAQTDQSKSCFSWLTTYGIKYVFKKINEETNGIFIKMPLWNIGASLSHDEKLCFIDADVWFENYSWLKSAYDMLDSYDVISLAGTIKESTTNAKVESIGKKIQQNDFNFKYGDAGFTLGMTRSAYEEYGHFDAVNYLDDQWFWFTVVGQTINSNDMFILPYKVPENTYNGYPFSIGSTDEICIHEQHHQKNAYADYILAQSFSFGKCDLHQDIKYDKTKPMILPKWNSSKIAKTIAKCFQRFFADFADNNTFGEISKKVFGKIDKNHPLIFVTSYIPDFKHKTSDCVIKLRNKLQQMCKSPFTFVCITDEKIVDINVIPFKHFRKNDVDDIIKSDKIVFPDNSTIIHIDIDQNIIKPFDVYRYQTTLIFLNNGQTTR